MFDVSASIGSRSISNHLLKKYLFGSNLKLRSTTFEKIVWGCEFCAKF